MVNIEQITSTLAKLPDQALQRYAMMHKDDPYIMSLAVSESKRRKEMRSAGQGQMQPQPKVVDQMVAQMAPQQQMPTMPEEQGIGALPAAAQMNFADGGITGYAGGGEVESYQDRGLVRPYETPYDRMNRQNREDAAAAQAEREAQAAAIGVTPYGEQMSRMGSAFANIPGEVLKTLVSAPGYGLSNLVGSPAPTAAQGAPTYQPEDTSGMDRRLASPGATLPMAANAAKEKAGGAGAGGAGTRDAVGAGTRDAGGVPARTPAAPAMSIEDRFLASQKKMTDQPNPFEVQESALQAEARKLAEDRLAGVKAGQEQFKDAFKGRETRLEERAKELEKSKDTNTGLAFLEAGLAIMSTPGGLATAIGKGAREGTAKYAAGIDKLRSAQEKLDDAKDRVEELKLNRAEMSAKELREAELDIQRTVLSGKKDALASSKALYGDRSALSQKIVETTIGIEQKDKDRATQVQTAGISAAMALKPQADFIADWLKKPENAGKTFSDAYAAFKSVGSAAERNDITGLKTVQAGLIKEISENITMDKATKAAKQAQIDDINKRILALSGAAAPSTQGGPQRTIDWNSIK
jgi:hypothetical protein